MRKLHAAVFGLTLVAGAAVAASPTAPVFYQIDTDANGFLTRAELVGARIYQVNFTSADANNDGMLSSSEYAAATSTGGGMQTDEIATTD